MPSTITGDLAYTMSADTYSFTGGSTAYVAPPVVGAGEVHGSYGKATPKQPKFSQASFNKWKKQMNF